MCTGKEWRPVAVNSLGPVFKPKARIHLRTARKKARGGSLVLGSDFMLIATSLTSSSGGSKSGILLQAVSICL